MTDATCKSCGVSGCPSWYFDIVIMTGEVLCMRCIGIYSTVLRRAHGYIGLLSLGPSS